MNVANAKTRDPEHRFYNLILSVCRAVKSRPGMAVPATKLELRVLKMAGPKKRKGVR